MSQLGDTLKGIIQISRGSIKILNDERVRGVLIDRLFATALRHEKAEMRGVARWIIKLTAQHFGTYFSPVEMFYKMIKSERNESITPPVFSVNRGMTSDVARAIFLAAIQVEAGFFLFRFEKNAFEEKKMTDSPEKHQVMIVAAAIQAHFSGPIFFTSETMDPWGVSTMDFPGFPQDAEAGDLGLLGEDEARLKEVVIKTFEKCHVIQTRQKAKNMTQGRERAWSLRDEISAAVTESPTPHGQAFITSLCSEDLPRQS